MTTTGSNRTTSRSRAVVARVRRATHAEGAGESGLAKLIELNAANSAADALVAVALAGSLFFSVPTDQARGRVALYLLITMAPFAVLAPAIGPILDRFRSGRRYALAVTMASRGVVAWLMASAIAHHQAALGLYPGAFAILVLSRAYGISRSAVLPRLLPRDASLVRSNARVSLAGTIAGLVIGAFGAGVVAAVGARWSLRLAGVVFALGAVLALRLPHHADSAEGEARIASLPPPPPPRPDPHAAPGEPGHRPWWLDPPDPPAGAFEQAETQILTEATRRERLNANLHGLGLAVTTALRGNAGLRCYSGFLTVFIAFLVRTTDLGPPRTMALGVIAVAAMIGGVAGQGLGAMLHGRAPQALILLALTVSTALAFVCALVFGLGTLILVGVAAGAGQAIGKLSLDSVIQKHVPDIVRTAAFARSETVLQIAFVTGGAIGLLPIDARVGMLAAGIGLAVVLLDVLRRQRRWRRA